MKKLCLLVALFAFTSTFAQEEDNKEKQTIKKGTWLLSTSTSFGTTKAEQNLNDEIREFESNRFEIRPSAGYAVSENLILGLTVGYSNTSSENASDNLITETKTNQFLVAPFVRGYKGVGKRLALFLQGEVSYARSNSENGNSINVIENDTNSYGVNLRPGISYFMSDNIALEATIGRLGYSYGKGEIDNQDESTNSNFGFELNTQNLFVGFSYYF